MHYFGEWRSFRVDRIQPLVGDAQAEPSSSSPTKRSDLNGERDVIRKLSELELESPTVEQHVSGETADSGPSDEVPIFKITARSKLKVVEHSVDDKDPKNRVVMIVCMRV